MSKIYISVISPKMIRFSASIYLCFRFGAVNNHYYFSLFRRGDKTTSNIYTRNTMFPTNPVNGDDTFKCPPLPERPSRFFEEPVYVDVDDK